MRRSTRYGGQSWAKANDLPLGRVRRALQPACQTSCTVRLSKTSAQAALAAAFLCQQNASTPTQARQVGDHLGIPVDSALKILQALTRAGILTSRLGRGGGYRLQREACEITLLQIVEAIDGPISGMVPIPVSSPEIGEAHRAISTQLLHEVCDRAAQRLRQELASLTVANLSSRRRRSRRRSHRLSETPVSPDDHHSPSCASPASSHKLTENVSTPIISRR